MKKWCWSLQWPCVVSLLCEDSFNICVFGCMAEEGRDKGGCGAITATKTKVEMQVIERVSNVDDVERCWLL